MPTRTRLRRLRSSLSPTLVLLAPILGALAPGPKWFYSVVYALGALLVYASYLFYQFLKPRAGALTALAAVSLIWALLSLVSAALPAHCPTSTVSSGRCTGSELASATLLGAILPAFPFIVLAPARVFYELVIRVLRIFRQPIGRTSPAKKPPRHLKS